MHSSPKKYARRFDAEDVESLRGEVANGLGADEVSWPGDDHNGHGQASRGVPAARPSTRWDH